MKVKFPIICLIMLLTSYGMAFQQIKKDTSYTVASTYKKLVKKHPDIKEVAIPEAPNLKIQKNLVYGTIGDRKLHLDRYENTSVSNAPAIILVHGGGWKSGDKKLMAPLAAHLALKGYQCFAVEYRLSDEAKYPAAIDDVTEAIRFIRKHAKEYQINKDNIVVLGASAGAQIATLVGYLEADLVRAVVNIDGVLAFRHPESSEGDMAAFWLGGVYEEAQENWENASPINHVSKNSPPILFISSSFLRFQAGRDDMIKKLDNYNIFSDHYTLPGSPHSFWLFHPWFEETLNHITVFLDKTIKKN